MLDYSSHSIIPNVPMAASINMFKSCLCISMVSHEGTFTRSASILRPSGGGEGTDFLAQPNLTIESSVLSAREVGYSLWPKPWDFG